MNTSDLRQELEKLETKITKSCSKNPVVKFDDLADYLFQHDAEMWAKEIYNKLVFRIKEEYDYQRRTNFL